MPGFEDDLDRLDTQINALENSIVATESVTASFEDELAQVRSSMAAASVETAALSSNLSNGLKRAFGDLIFDGARLSDVLRNVARSMVESAFGRAINPLTDAIGSLFATGAQNLVGGMLPFEKGAAFSSGRVTPFAKGGIVAGPTTFPMRGGLGLMGEAGAEAIMPLSRGADGKLGVRGAVGSRQVTVNMNISTPDVAGFQKSRTQIAANISRAIQRGGRNI